MRLRIKQPEEGREKILFLFPFFPFVSIFFFFLFLLTYLFVISFVILHVLQFFRTPRVASKVGGDCDPKTGDGIGNGFIQVHVCSRRHVAGRQHAETAPYWNSTSLEDGGPAGAELHTARSRSVTAQEGLGNGYIRSKLLPLVDRMT